MLVSFKSVARTDVGMIDLGQEPHFRWCHRIVLWKKELEFENTIYEGKYKGVIRLRT